MCLCVHALTLFHECVYVCSHAFLLSLTHTPTPCVLWGVQVAALQSPPSNPTGTVLSDEFLAGKAAPAAAAQSELRKRAKRTLNQTGAALSAEFLAESAEFLRGGKASASTAEEALGPVAPAEPVAPVPVGVMEIWRSDAHPDEVNYFLPP